MCYKKDRGITLAEIIIVVVIIGILAALALPQFTATRERALGREAKANLKLISAAEKIYRMEVGTYYPDSGSQTDKDAINTNLKLSLTETNWDYRITGGASTFTAYGNRVDTAQSPYRDCEYSLAYNDSDGEPDANSTTNCP